jgi:hypothetical protein
MLDYGWGVSFRSVWKYRPIAFLDCDSRIWMLRILKLSDCQPDKVTLLFNLLLKLFGLVLCNSLSLNMLELVAYCSFDGFPMLLCRDIYESREYSET